MNYAIISLFFIICCINLSTTTIQLTNNSMCDKYFTFTDGKFNFVGCKVAAHTTQSFSLTSQFTLGNVIEYECKNDTWFPITADTTEIAVGPQYYVAVEVVTQNGNVPFAKPIYIPVASSCR